MLQFTAARVRDEQLLRTPRTPGTSVCLAPGSAACHASNRARDSTAACIDERRFVRSKKDAPVNNRARHQSRPIQRSRSSTPAAQIRKGSSHVGILFDFRCDEIHRFAGGGDVGFTTSSWARGGGAAFG